MKPLSRKRLGLWTKDKRSEVDGAGCLVILGLLLLLPVLLYSSFKIVMLGKLLASRFSSAKASEWLDLLQELGHDLWQWLLGRSDSGESSPILVLFLAGYIALFWQWVSFLLGWQSRRASSRLWAASTIYMLAAMVVFAVATWPADQSAAGLPLEDLGGWLFGTLAFCILAGAFLCATVSLWVISSRAAAKRANTPAPKPDF